MIEVINVYKTSKGLFHFYDDAMKHRAKNTDPFDPNFGQRELVNAVDVLEMDGRFYDLSPLEVKIG